jgi:hypothetical protein
MTEVADTTLGEGRFDADMLSKGVPGKSLWWMTGVDDTALREDPVDADTLSKTVPRKPLRETTEVADITLCKGRVGRNFIRDIS